MIKNKKREDVEVDILPNQVSVSVKVDNNRESQLHLELSKNCIPADSKFAVLSTKIEISLAKEFAERWNTLEQSQPTEAPVAYPSSAKKVLYELTKKSDWGAVEKSIEDEKPEGEKALHEFFQSIYKNATPETQRAMMKSFQESNGTALSTNWEEVKKEKVKVTPPDGMVAKKFDI